MLPGVARTIAMDSVPDVCTSHTTLTSSYIDDVPLARVPNRNHTRVRKDGRIDSCAHLRALDSLHTAADNPHTPSHTAERYLSSPQLSSQSDVAARRCSRGSRHHQPLGTEKGSSPAIHIRGRSASSRLSRGGWSSPQASRLQWCISGMNGPPRSSEGMSACVRKTQTDRHHHQ